MYLTKLENEEVLKKKMIHKRELDNLVNERALQRSYAEQPVTHDTLRQLRLHPQQLEKLML